MQKQRLVTRDPFGFTCVCALGFVLLMGCGDEAYGECVTVYTDGDTYRYDTDKAYCESTCAERMAESDAISRCYFAG